MYKPSSCGDCLVFPRAGRNSGMVKARGLEPPPRSVDGWFRWFFFRARMWQRQRRWRRGPRCLSARLTALRTRTRTASFARSRTTYLCMKLGVYAAHSIATYAPVSPASSSIFFLFSFFSIFFLWSVFHRASLYSFLYFFADLPGLGAWPTCRSRSASGTANLYVIHTPRMSDGYLSRPRPPDGPPALLTARLIPSFPPLFSVSERASGMLRIWHARTAGEKSNFSESFQRR